jgi:hypothetical protein
MVSRPLSEVWLVQRGVVAVTVARALVVSRCVLLRFLAASFTAIASNQVVVCSNCDLGLCQRTRVAVRGALSVRDRRMCSFFTMTSTLVRVCCAADIGYGSVQPSFHVADAQGGCRLQLRSLPPAPVL